MPASSLVRPLFPGSIDIVADVHGEDRALGALLRRLGYDEAGLHPQGRRLVFLGDLVDRGEDSPAVVRRVAALVGRGLAQCVLGNHELNLLRGLHKHGNAWFYGYATEDLDDSGTLVPQVPADQEIRGLCRTFFRSLPLALVSDELVVVHACPDPVSLEQLQGETEAVALLERQEALIHRELERLQRGAEVEPVLARFGMPWEQAAVLFGPLQETGTVAEGVRQGLAGEVGCELAEQNFNPVKVLTSGPERRVAVPFYAGGKWRVVGRVPWWEGYTGHRDVVFGHYWRVRLPEELAADHPFDDARPFAPLGNGKALCIDYSAGKRWMERRSSAKVYRTALAALRWPERVLVLDSGREVPVG